LWAALNKQVPSDGEAFIKAELRTGGCARYVGLSYSGPKALMIPDIQLGIVVLTNQESSGAFFAIGHQIEDRYLGVPDSGWIEGYRKLGEKRRADAEERPPLSQEWIRPPR